MRHWHIRYDARGSDNPSFLFSSYSGFRKDGWLELGMASRLQNFAPKPLVELWRGQPFNPGLFGKWPLKWDVCACVMNILSWNRRHSRSGTTKQMVWYTRVYRPTRHSIGNFGDGTTKQIVMAQTWMMITG